MTEKVALFLNKMNTIKKNVKIFFWEYAGKNKTLVEKCAKVFKEIHSEFMSPGTP